MTWCLAFVRGYPLANQGTEPALTMANMILSAILGPPFRWRWNRNSINFAITQAGGGDYLEAVSDFGFLEGGYIIDGTNAIFEVGIKQMLAKGIKQARPFAVAAQLDDNQGNITFRFLDVPDKNYNAELLYQKKAVLMSSAASTWNPIPDEMNHIFNWGFLSLAGVLANDARFPIYNQKFVSSLLATASGLTEMERNLFLANWESVIRSGLTQLRGEQGVKARANL